MKNGKRASATIANTGALTGADVAQLYLVSRWGQVAAPPCRFGRVQMKPGRSHHVAMEIDQRLLIDWNGQG